MPIGQLQSIPFTEHEESRPCIGELKTAADPNEIPQHARGVPPDFERAAATPLPFDMDRCDGGRIGDEFYIKCKSPYSLSFKHRAHQSHVEQLKSALGIFNTCA